LELNPEDAKIMSNMGVLMLKLQKEKEAQIWFQTALEFNPDDIIAKEALKKIT